MSPDWRAIESLVMSLGKLREAGDTLRRQDVEEAIQLAVEDAISEATDAVSRTIDDQNEPTVAKAWEAIEVAQQVLVALDAEVARSHRVLVRVSTPAARAQELIAQARKAQKRKKP